MKSVTIYFIAFISGAVVMAFEILGSRILAPDFGTSVFVWGSLIGIFMAGLSAGYFLGGKLSDRRTSFITLAVLLFMSGIVLLLFPLYGLPVSERISGLDLGPRLGPFAVSTALFFLPSLLMGMITPCCTRLLIREILKVGHGIGSLYAVSTLGSIIGTIGTSFFLITWTGTKASLLLIGGIMIATSVLAVLTRSPREQGDAVE